MRSLIKSLSFISIIISSSSTLSLVSADSSFQCKGQQDQYQQCNAGKCKHDACVDCVWDDWDDWGPCTCVGLKERHREIYTHNNQCGQPCSGSKVETKACTPECDSKPVDCKLGDWQEWTECTKLCGGGQSFRARQVIQMPSNGGLPCSTDLSQVKACNTKACSEPQNCMLTSWGDWSTCSKSCNGGIQERSRKIEIEPAYGGDFCENQDLKEVRGCNEESCEEVKSCIWGQWSSWSACSRSCNGGTKSRMRLVDQAPRNGGDLCPPEDMVELAKCNDLPCGEPQDCSLSEWSDWDDCTWKCNGVTTRTREIAQYSAYGGKPCSGAQILKEVEGCNTDQNSEGCKDKSEENLKVVIPDVDCKFSDWTEWTECPVTCGGGSVSRQRTIETNASGKGSQCTGSLSESKECGAEQCAYEGEIIECQYSEWDSWSDCSVSCGRGEKMRGRSVLQMPNSHGASCARERVLEVEKCDLDKCECDDCIFGEWSEWGAATCTGLCERHRDIIQHADPSCGGQPCIGEKVETKRCDDQLTCQKEPIDCELSDWSSWSPCNVECGGGSTVRSRKIVTHESHGGKSCIGNDGESSIELKQTKACNIAACSEKIDCQLGEWSSWSSCSSDCDGGQSFRTRTIEQEALHGGSPCKEASLKEIKGCNFFSCPTDIDCVIGEWTDWSACSRSCGGGHKVRDRAISTSPRGNGGKLCKAFVKSEVDECNTNVKCSDEDGSQCVDALWGPWSDWSECTASCEGGYSFRSRGVARFASGKDPISGEICGRALDGPAQEFQKCNTDVSCMGDNEPIDCAFSHWSDWSDCSCPCFGVRDRSRRVEKLAAFGGKPCEGRMKEVEGCNFDETNCPEFAAVDCKLGDWSDWSDCSTTCGGGLSERRREIAQFPKNRGKSCAAVDPDNMNSNGHGFISEDQKPILHQIKSCGSDTVCDAGVDCAWGEWGDYDTCSKSCGGGQQSRFRHVGQMPKKNGRACEAGDSIQTRGCNESPCGETNYCYWGEWSDYGYCSSTCGNGIMKRSRYLEIGVGESGRPVSTVKILATSLVESITSLGSSFNHLLSFTSIMNSISPGGKGPRSTDVKSAEEQLLNAEDTLLSTKRFTSDHVLLTFLSGFGFTFLLAMMVSRVAEYLSSTSGSLNNLGDSRPLVEQDENDIEMGEMVE